MILDTNQANCSFLQSSEREEITKLTQHMEVSSELWIILLPSWLQGPQERVSQEEKR